MKTIRILLFALALTHLAAHSRAADPALTVAVFNFQTTGEKLASKGAEAALLLNAQLSTAPDIVLVERQEIDKALGEQELGLSGTVSPETAARVGAILGAKVIVTGRIFEAGAKYYLVAKIIGTETSRVFGEAVTFNDPAALDKAIAELGPKITTIVTSKADALVAKQEDAAARLARLKQVLGGRKLLTVSVTIVEQHVGRTVIDPAAETEMKLVLQQLGFEIVDAKDVAKPAEVAVSGEAFSEVAGRRGNLISCRARIEIKVTRPADGNKLLLADRQTDVAVDLAEQIAGKSALENAALKLLDRLVPKLVAP